MRVTVPWAQQHRGKHSITRTPLNTLCIKCISCLLTVIWKWKVLENIWEPLISLSFFYMAFDLSYSDLLGLLHQNLSLLYRISDSFFFPPSLLSSLCFLFSKDSKLELTGGQRHLQFLSWKREGAPFSGVIKLRNSFFNVTSKGGVWSPE